jgi:hypothetical protein
MVKYSVKARKDIHVVEWIKKTTTRRANYSFKVVPLPTPAPRRSKTPRGASAGRQYSLPQFDDVVQIPPTGNKSRRTPGKVRLIMLIIISVANCPKSQNDLMRDWLGVRKEYLQCILSLEAPVGDHICYLCKADSPGWRCLDCLGKSPICTDCCRDNHTRLPFHRVERWTGSHYEPAWLRDAGVSIQLGHSGNSCPTVLPPDDQRTVQAEPDGLQDDADEVDAQQHAFYPQTAPPPGSFDTNGNTIMIIVDRSGIHYIGVKPCRCSTAESLDRQLLRIGLYPASQKQPRTAFTFEVLDDYLIENRECKVSALRFYSKLRRVTNNAFPASAPVRSRRDFSASDINNSNL